MYTVSALWATLIATDGHWFETKVDINGVTYGQDQLMSLSVDLRMFAEQQPSVGGCLAGEINLSMLAPSVSIPRMASIDPYVRVCAGVQQSEWIPQGKYYIDTREITKNDDNLNILTLHGFDSMLKSEAGYPSTSHSWPYTDINVVNEIATTMGVGVDSRTTDLMTNAYQIGLPAGMTMREALGNIAAMYAGNFVMSYDGELLLIAANGIPPETNYLVDAVGDAITFGGDRILV